MQRCVRTNHHAVTPSKRPVRCNPFRATTRRSTERAHKTHRKRCTNSTADSQMSVDIDEATSTLECPIENNDEPETSARQVTRRQVIHNAITGSLVQGAVTVFPALGPPPSAAASLEATSPPIGLILPVTDSFGIAAVRDPALYRGMATEQTVRSKLHMQGLLPFRQVPLQVEIDRAYAAIEACKRDIDKYQMLAVLREQNQDAFFGLLSQHLTELLPVIYTPTVGDACKQWSTLLQRPQGLYVSIKDKGNVRALVSNWPSKEVRIAVLTDGERILGLGDLGINGMGIPVGKAMVYTAAAGVDPRQLLPVSVDVGCNVASVRDQPLYMGLQQERVRGKQYDELIDELIEALRERYGTGLIIHWEDFNVQNSFRLLDKYVDQGVCTFNDDIQSTAAAVLGAIYGALRLDGVPPLKQQKFLFFGAGQANIGAARLLVAALADEGLSETEAKMQIYLYDSKGLVYEGRQAGRLTPQKLEFARTAAEADNLPSGSSLLEATQQLQPSALIGAAAKQGAFSADVIAALTKGVQQQWGKGSRPIVLALSNPTEVAECTAQEAYDWSQGRAVYASGTAFAPFRTNDGQMYVPAQANNSLIFPGVGLGCIAAGAKQITADVMLAAAKAAAVKLTSEELQQGSILPQADRISQVGLSVAAAVASCIQRTQHGDAGSRFAAHCLPVPPDVLADGKALRRIEQCIAEQQYKPFEAQHI